MDVETTGMSPVDDRITEVALMKVHRGTIVDEFSTLINPLMTIPAFITNLTGIDNLMVRDASSAREVIPFLAEFLRSSVFVAHNAGFDWGFVYHTALREREIHLTNPQVCTVRLSRRILPARPSNSLDSVTRFLHISIPQRHRASGDAYATEEVLKYYLSYLQESCGLRTLRELLQYQNTPRSQLNYPPFLHQMLDKKVGSQLDTNPFNKGRNLNAKDI